MSIFLCSDKMVTMNNNKSIEVNGTLITVCKHDDGDYISLTDIVNAKAGNARAADVIKNWIRNRGTLEFIGTWEQLNNPDFKVVEFDHFKMQAGLPTFVLSVGQWVEKTADMLQPMGVSEYILIESLPNNLKGSLPTVEEIEFDLQQLTDSDERENQE